MSNNSLLDAAIEHFDPIYEQGHDVTGFEIMDFVHAAGYPLIHEVSGTVRVIRRRYPTRNKAERPGIVAPLPPADANDYELLADYDLDH